MTGHAEWLLATQASRSYEPRFLAGCTHVGVDRFFTGPGADPPQPTTLGAL